MYNQLYFFLAYSSRDVTVNWHGVSRVKIQVNSGQSSGPPMYNAGSGNTKLRRWGLRDKHGQLNGQIKLRKHNKSIKSLRCLHCIILLYQNMERFYYRVKRCLQAYIKKVDNLWQTLRVYNCVIAIFMAYRLVFTC